MQVENISQYEVYFMQFLNTQKLFHQHDNDVDASVSYLKPLD